MLAVVRIGLVWGNRTFHVFLDRRFVATRPLLSVFNISIVVLDFLLLVLEPAVVLHFLMLLLPPTLFHLPVELVFHFLPLALKFLLLIVEELLGKQSASVAALL